MPGDRGSRLHAIEEVRILEERAQHQLDADVEVVRLDRERGQPHVAGDLVVRERPPERPAPERAHERVQAGRVAGARRRAAEQRVAPGGVGEQPGRGAGGQRLRGGDQRARHLLRREVVVERIVDVLGQRREAGPRVVAQQIGEGVVVFDARQPVQSRRAVGDRAARRSAGTPAVVADVPVAGCEQCGGEQHGRADSLSPPHTQLAPLLHGTSVAS